MQNVGLYLRDEFYTCSLQSCILLTQLKEGMHEATAAQNVQCMHMAPVVLAGSNNKVAKVLWELICFTHHEMFLVWHIGNETPFQRPSVGTEATDINLH